jgi:hypothetical protein
MSTPKKTVSRVFDIRNIIGALLAIYGVLLTIAGLVPGLVASHDDAAAAANKVDLYVGTDANWWVGLALIVVAAVFVAWAAIRPVVIDVDSERDADDG